LADPFIFIKAKRTAVRRKFIKEFSGLVYCSVIKERVPRKWLVCWLCRPRVSCLSRGDSYILSSVFRHVNRKFQFF
jgi:hypothetical protein